MISILLSIIYVAFISLGLPDSLLGAGWPVMSGQLGVPVAYAGIVSMIIAGGTIVSSLLSNRVTRRFGPGLVTAFSVGLTAVALMGTALAPSFIVICIFALPYGLGAGGVDAALNNYVAIHFKARHMSWLHCFWGIGASLSPYIMGRFLLGPYGWKGGYGAVGIIQIFLSIAFFLSLPLWKKTTLISEQKDNTTKVNKSIIRNIDVLKIKGVFLILITFFAYCGLETTAGLWASSYLAKYKGISVEIAARFASLFYIGITAGRFIVGFITEKIGDRRLIRCGIIIVGIGVILIMIPNANDIFSLVGLVIAGLGCAPIYPSIIHSTPGNFGIENSQAIVGIQMASAYLGSTFMPPLFGAIGAKFTLGLYPVFLFGFVIVMFVASELLNIKLRKNQN